MSSDATISGGSVQRCAILHHRDHGTAGQQMVDAQMVSGCGDAVLEVIGNGLDRLFNG